MKNAKSTMKNVPVSSITIDPRYREDLGDLDELVESIKLKGLLQPITLTTDFHLLAGHRRLSATQKLGWDTIPALVRKIEGEIDAREIELIENIHRKSFTWQEEAALIGEIDRLYKEKDEDWSIRKTAQLLNKSKSGVAAKLELAKALEAIPELKEYKTADDARKVLKNMEETVVTDELFRRQQERIKESRQISAPNTSLIPDSERAVHAAVAYADRCYAIGDVFAYMSRMPTSGKIDIIECDPPYGISLGTIKMSDGVVPKNQSYNEVPEAKYETFLSNLTSELFRVSAPNAWLVFWFGPTWHCQVLHALQNAGWMIDVIPCIWTKPAGQSMQPEYYFARCYEPFFLCRKGQPVMHHRGRSNVLSFAPEVPSEKYHPTQRPCALIKEILERLGTGMSKVFVPFAGSGTTLRVCNDLGFEGFGIDISGEYKKKFLLLVEKDTRAMLTRESQEA